MAKNVIRNRNARIDSRFDRTGKIRTETLNRDPDTIKAAVSTNPKTNATRLYVDFPPDEVVHKIAFTGSEARTLYRVLKRHFTLLNGHA